MSDLPERTATLFACSRGERAFEDSENEHGAFTYSLLEKIKKHSGPALTAASLGEHLEDAVAKRVKKITNGKQSQTPRYLSHSKVDLLLKMNKEQAKTEDDSYRPEDSYFAPSLYPGMKAPALGKLEFIEGEPVEEFKPGTVYVLNTFASWCGPCLPVIPMLATLQQKFPQVVFIEIDTSGREDAEVFLKNDKYVGELFTKDRKVGYRFAALRDGRLDGWGNNEFWRTWMLPSESRGIPTTFVIDSRSRIAWIGHPSDLVKEDIVKQLTEGNFDIQEVKQRFLNTKIYEGMTGGIYSLNTEAKLLERLELCHPTREAHKVAVEMLVNEWSEIVDSATAGKPNSLSWSSTTKNRLRSLVEIFVERNRDDLDALELRFYAMVKEIILGNKERAKAEFEKWRELVKRDLSKESEEVKEKRLKELDTIQKRLEKFLDMR